MVGLIIAFPSLVAVDSKEHQKEDLQLNISLPTDDGAVPSFDIPKESEEQNDIQVSTFASFVTVMKNRSNTSRNTMLDALILSFSCALPFQTSASDHGRTSIRSISQQGT